MVHATDNGIVTECGILIDLRYESAIDGSGAARPSEVFRNINADMRCYDCERNKIVDIFYHALEGVESRQVIEAARAHMHKRIAGLASATA